MNLSTALATFLLLAGDVHAFSVVSRPSTLSSISSALHASDEPSKKKVLRAEDVIAGGKAKGDDAEEAPKLFTPDIYDDFQSALVKLERRVKDGSGTLSAVEVKELVDETDRIVAEMNAFLEDPASAGLNWSGAGGGAPNAITPEVVAPTPVDIPENDDGNDEPAYDPESGGGFGLAAGTRNTYAIEGMDSMSPEEYRAKLQETISGRQAQRRSANLEGPRDLIGNRSSSGYLDALSRGQSGAGGGGGAMYKGEEKKEEKGEHVSEFRSIPPPPPPPPEDTLLEAQEDLVEVLREKLRLLKERRPTTPAPEPTLDSQQDSTDQERHPQPASIQEQVPPMQEEEDSSNYNGASEDRERVRPSEKEDHPNFKAKLHLGERSAIDYGETALTKIANAARSASGSSTRVTTTRQPLTRASDLTRGSDEGLKKLVQGSAANSVARKGLGAEPMRKIDWDDNPLKKLLKEGAAAEIPRGTDREVGRKIEWGDTMMKKFADAAGKISRDAPNAEQRPTGPGHRVAEGRPAGRRRNRSEGKKKVDWGETLLKKLSYDGAVDGEDYSDPITGERRATGVRRHNRAEGRKQVAYENTLLTKLSHDGDTGVTDPATGERRATGVKRNNRAEGRKQIAYEETLLTKLSYDGDIGVTDPSTGERRATGVKRNNRAEGRKIAYEDTLLTKLSHDGDTGVTDHITGERRATGVKRNNRAEGRKIAYEDSLLTKLSHDGDIGVTDPTTGERRATGRVKSVAEGQKKAVWDDALLKKLSYKGSADDGFTEGGANNPTGETRATGRVRSVAEGQKKAVWDDALLKKLSHDGADGGGANNPTGETRATGRVRSVAEGQKKAVWDDALLKKLSYDGSTEGGANNPTGEMRATGRVRSVAEGQKTASWDDALLKKLSHAGSDGGGASSYGETRATGRVKSVTEGQKKAVWGETLLKTLSPKGKSSGTEGQKKVNWGDSLLKKLSPKSKGLLEGRNSVQWGDTLLKELAQDIKRVASKESVPEHVLEEALLKRLSNEVGGVSVTVEMEDALLKRLSNDPPKKEHKVVTRQPLSRQRGGSSVGQQTNAEPESALLKILSKESENTGKSKPRQVRASLNTQNHEYVSQIKGGRYKRIVKEQTDRQDWMDQQQQQPVEERRKVRDEFERQQDRNRDEFERQQDILLAQILGIDPSELRPTGETFDGPTDPDSILDEAEEMDELSYEEILEEDPAMTLTDPPLTYEEWSAESNDETPPTSSETKGSSHEQKVTGGNDPSFLTIPLSKISSLVTPTGKSGTKITGGNDIGFRPIPQSPSNSLSNHASNVRGDEGGTGRSIGGNDISFAPNPDSPLNRIFDGVSEDSSDDGTATGNTGGAANQSSGGNDRGFASIPRGSLGSLGQQAGSGKQTSGRRSGGNTPGFFSFPLSSAENSVDGVDKLYNDEQTSKRSVYNPASYIGSEISSDDTATGSESSNSVSTDENNQGNARITGRIIRNSSTGGNDRGFASIPEASSGSLTNISKQVPTGKNTSGRRSGGNSPGNFAFPLSSAESSVDGVDKLYSDEKSFRRSAGIPASNSGRVDTSRSRSGSVNIPTSGSESSSDDTALGIESSDRVSTDENNQGNDRSAKLNTGGNDRGFASIPEGSSRSLTNISKQVPTGKNTSGRRSGGNSPGNFAFPLSSAESSVDGVDKLYSDEKSFRRSVHIPASSSGSVDIPPSNSGSIADSTVDNIEYSDENSINEEIDLIEREIMQREEALKEQEENLKRREERFIIEEALKEERYAREDALKEQEENLKRREERFIREEALKEQEERLKQREETFARLEKESMETNESREIGTSSIRASTAGNPESNSSSATSNSNTGGNDRGFSSIPRGSMTNMVRQMKSGKSDPIRRSGGNTPGFGTIPRSGLGNIGQNAGKPEERNIIGNDSDNDKGGDIGTTARTPVDPVHVEPVPPSMSRRGKGKSMNQQMLSAIGSFQINGGNKPESYIGNLSRNKGADPRQKENESDPYASDGVDEPPPSEIDDTQNDASDTSSQRSEAPTRTSLGGNGMDFLSRPPSKMSKLSKPVIPQKTTEVDWQNAHVTQTKSSIPHSDTASSHSPEHEQVLANEQETADDNNENVDVSDNDLEEENQDVTIPSLNVNDEDNFETDDDLESDDDDGYGDGEDEDENEVGAQEAI